MVRDRVGNLGVGLGIGLGAGLIIEIASVRDGLTIALTARHRVMRSECVNKRCMVKGLCLHYHLSFFVAGSIGEFGELNCNCPVTAVNIDQTM